VRFSTVAGSRGSADTVRDVHGFATRFYTDEGNFGKCIIVGLGPNFSLRVWHSSDLGVPWSVDNIEDKLLTSETDCVGNNIPVFFIQDAIKFPDLIHAVKPQPDREIPQAATAHDSAWDFFSQQPSTLHTLSWAMSGHGTVRSYRHMDGWGVHTVRTLPAFRGIR
jgi:catalase